MLITLLTIDSLAMRLLNIKINSFKRPELIVEHTHCTNTVEMVPMFFLSNLKTSQPRKVTQIAFVHCTKLLCCVRRNAGNDFFYIF